MPPGRRENRYQSRACAAIVWLAKIARFECHHRTARIADCFDHLVRAADPLAVPTTSAPSRAKASAAAVPMLLPVPMMQTFPASPFDMATS
jgi:hypothetical protein